MMMKSMLFSQSTEVMNDEMITEEVEDETMTHLKSQ